MEGSSLKHFNFQKYTPQQIIDKYESVLAGREEQITLLSLEMGQLNDRLTTFQEENTTLLEENASLKLKLSKKESLLSQELNNKEIMFIRLEKKEKEYDLLKKQYDILLKSLEGKTIIATKSQKTEYVSTPVVVEKEVNSSNNEMNVNPNNPFNDVVDGEEKGKESEGNGSKQNEDKDKQVKMSARDKIKELKAKTGNVTKLNFSQILQAKKDAASKKDNKEDKQEKDKEKDNQSEIASTQVNQDNVVENKEENTQ